MLPVPILTALAPIVVDAIKGDGKVKLPPVIETVIEQTMGHEKRKASVRPMVMKMTGVTSVLIAGAGVVAALSPLAGVPQETADAMVMNLLYLFGAVGGAYGVQHGARTVEKSVGKS